MVTILAKIFIKNEDSIPENELRKQYGALSGSLGIVLNFILCIIKFIAGFMSGSIGIISDAANNLSDAGSSVVMLVGFKLAGKKPDPEHPYGHGRFEYITGMIISIFTIVLGVEMLRTSVMEILNPSVVVFSAPLVVCLIVSFAIKIYMYAYNHKLAVRFKSSAIQAAAIDSVSDSLATCFVILCTLLNVYKGLKLDGVCGVVVSIVIIYSGISSSKETISQLLGSAPDPEFVKTIETYVTTYDQVLGIHDMVVHDYGPGRMMISFHAEVPSNGDIMELHDMIDVIEKKLFDALGCLVVIHMDPIVVDDESVSRMRNLIGLLVHGVDESLSMHDFRMVTGPTHTNLIFDLLVPYEIKRTDAEVKAEVEKRIQELPGNHFAVITIDKPFVTSE